MFQEMEDLRYRKDLSQGAIANICGVKPSSASKWFEKKKIDDKYLWIIANSEYGDDRFMLALLCYELRLPTNIFKYIKKKQRGQLSRLGWRTTRGQ